MICQQNQELLKQIQELKDEINRLKGEKGKPKILPKTQETESLDISSESHTKEKKKWKKKSKKQYYQR